MKDGERLSLEQIQAFLEGSEEVVFKAASQKELYAWTERTLCAQECMRLGRNGKGLVRRSHHRQLDRMAGAQSDTGAANKMQQAKARLFASFAQQRKSA